MKAIFDRKSIRKYTEEQVSKENIKEILRAAMAAPSARNQQPWEFIVVRDKEKINEIIEVSPYTTPLKTAPVAIVVCGNLHRETAEGYWVQDCSAAIENMLIQITHMGLGAVWMGIYPREERVEKLKKTFNLPQSVIPLAVIAVGYPDEHRPNSDRFNEDRIHYETWECK